MNRPDFAGRLENGRVPRETVSNTVQEDPSKAPAHTCITINESRSPSDVLGSSLDDEARLLLARVLLMQQTALCKISAGMRLDMETLRQLELWSLFEDEGGPLSVACQTPPSRLALDSQHAESCRISSKGLVQESLERDKKHAELMRTFLQAAQDSAHSPSPTIQLVIQLKRWKLLGLQKKVRGDLSVERELWKLVEPLPPPTSPPVSPDTAHSDFQEPVEPVASSQLQATTGVPSSPLTPFATPHPPAPVVSLPPPSTGSAPSALSPYPPNGLAVEIWGPPTAAPTSAASLETAGSTVLLDWGLMRLSPLDAAASLWRWDLRSSSSTPHHSTRLSYSANKDGASSTSPPLAWSYVSAFGPAFEVERLHRWRDPTRAHKEARDRAAADAAARANFLSALQAAYKQMSERSAADAKRAKQRCDAVTQFHVRMRQRASRAERLRVQALKAGDQEAYLRLVEESKNERLKTLLGKTDELLASLGAMVALQKEGKGAGEETQKAPKEKQQEGIDAAAAGSPDTTAAAEFATELETAAAISESAMAAAPAPRDLMAGQRTYARAVHSIEERVTEQPASLAGGRLREYQIEGLQWMLSLYNNGLNGILADEMGLGKTIQSISLIAYLMERKGVGGPHLILAPKAVLSNWASEFRIWLPNAVVVMYDGRQDERRALKDRYGTDGHTFNVLLTHYDLVMRDKSYLRKIQWHYLIVDEGHRLKNHESVLARTLVGGYTIRRRLLLTGTPIQNSLGELWSLLNFILPAVFNSSGNFEEWFNAPFAADKAEVALNEEEQLLVINRLHQVLRPFLLRRRKAEVEKYLPQKTQVVLKCDLSAWQREYYRQIITKGRIAVSGSDGKGGGVGGSRALMNTAMQLRKCCNHPFLFLEDTPYEPAWQEEQGQGDRKEGEGEESQQMEVDGTQQVAAGWKGSDVPRPLPAVGNGDQSMHDQQQPAARPPPSLDIVRASGKFMLLDSMLPKLHATGHRVLLFSQMTRVLDLLEDFLVLRGFQYQRLDGSTKTDEREGLLQRFNAPRSEMFVFLLSTRAGGLGLNLQSADTVIMFDSDWNPQMDQQAEDRAHRIGQTREVRVFVLVSLGSIEEVILERARNKRGIDAKVIQAGMFNNTSTAQERRELLEDMIATAKERAERRGGEGEGDEGEASDGDVPSKHELNRLMARDGEEFRLFEELDAKEVREGRALHLMRKEEVPAWVYAVTEEKVEEEEEKEEAEEEGGRGQRKMRKRTTSAKYSDGVSDELWLRMVGDGEEEEVVREEKGRRRGERSKSVGGKETGGGDNVVGSEGVELPSPLLLRLEDAGGMEDGREGEGEVLGATAEGLQGSGEGAAEDGGGMGEGRKGGDVPAGAVQGMGEESREASTRGSRKRKSRLPVSTALGEGIDLGGVAGAGDEGAGEESREAESTPMSQHAAGEVEGVADQGGPTRDGPMVTPVGRVRRHKVRFRIE